MTHYCIRRYCGITGKSEGVLDYRELRNLGLRGLNSWYKRLNTPIPNSVIYRVERRKINKNRERNE